MKEIIKLEGVELFIFQIRDQKVMIDRDLALLYGVETKYLNRQVRRNTLRFPPEFMFQLNEIERNELVTICHRFTSMKHSTSLPYAFTEHGIAMLSTVLNSEQSIRMNIHIIKTFIRLRVYIKSHNEVDVRLNALEEKVDNQFALVFDELNSIITIKNEPMNPIGFKIGQ